MTNEEDRYRFAASKNDIISQRWVYDSQNPQEVRAHKSKSLLERFSGHSVREMRIDEISYLLLRDVQGLGLNLEEKHLAVAGN